MNNDVITLFEFLERLGPEVLGRSISGPSGKALLQLQRFARGECDPAERYAVCEMLREHPLWIRWLADRVKQSRILRAVQGSN